MIFIISKLVLHDVIESRLAIVWEVQNVEHVFLLGLDHVPTEVNDAFES